MKAFLHLADSVIRAGPAAIEDDRPLRRMGHLCLVLTVFGLMYGTVMGSFGAITGQRLWQVVFSAVKLPLLLTGAFLLSVPSFFVINTLAGVRSDFPRVVRALIATQAGLTVILASLAPLTVVWYISFSGYREAIVFNVAMFAAASVSAQRVLGQFYKPMARRRPAHRWLRYAWLVIYAFVAVQMAWILRPFIGAPGVPTHFFRQEAWGNAYVKLGETLWRVLGG